MLSAAHLHTEKDPDQTWCLVLGAGGRPAAGRAPRPTIGHIVRALLMSSAGRKKIRTAAMHFLRTQKKPRRQTPAGRGRGAGSVIDPPRAGGGGAVDRARHRVDRYRRRDRCAPDDLRVVHAAIQNKNGLHAVAALDE